MEEDLKKEISESELGPVRDIFKTLTKTIKTFNVYPKDNPIYRKFAEELFEKFNIFFEISDELSVDIDQHSLSYKDNVVFHSEERTDNMALLLFADGIRELDFYKGITHDEITDFIDILRFAPKSATSDEDDIVTLLWEKNIKNMGYATVEDTVDDNLAVEEGLLQEGIAQDAVTEITSGGVSGGASSSYYSVQGIKAFSAGPGTELLTDAEIGDVKNELSGLEDQSLLYSSADLFFELLSHHEDTEAFSDIVQNIGKIIVMLMQKNDIQGTIGILGRLREISEVYPAPQQQGIIGSALRRAGTPGNLRILFRGAPDSGDIRRYLLLLEKDSITDMIEMLGELQDRKHRRLLCEILAEAGRQDIDAFSAALDDNRWYLVRNIVMILGMTKLPSAVKHIGKVLKHADLRVRREAVRAMEGTYSEETRNLFISALNDADLTVRIAAFKALRRFRDAGIFESLKGYAAREELKKKSFIEKKEIIETLAALGGENAFQAVSDLFQRQHLIEKDDTTEIRAAAAYGLGILGTPEAVSLLEKGATSRKTILSEACVKALKGLQQGEDIRR